MKKVNNTFQDYLNESESTQYYYQNVLIINVSYLFGSSLFRCLQDTSIL